MSKPLMNRVLFRSGVGAVLLSSVLIGAIAIGVVFSFVPNDIKDRNEAITSMASQQLESFLQLHQDQVQILGQSIAAAKSEQEFAAASRSLLQWTSGVYESIRILDTTGKVVATYGHSSEMVGFDQSREAFFLNLGSNGLVVWSPIYLNTGDNTPHVSASVRAGSHIVVADISLQYLAQYMQHIKIRAGLGISLLDRNGTYIYDADPTRAAERATFFPFRDIQKAEVEHPNKPHMIRMNDRFWEASLRQIPTTGWSLLLLSDPTVVYESVFTLVISVVGLLLILLLVFSIGSATLFNRLLEPVDRFVGQIRMMSQGHYEKMRQEEPFQEFVLMRDQFNRMVDHIEDRQTQLIELNRRLEAELGENRKSGEAFQALMRTVARATGDDFYRLISKTLGDWLKVDMVIVGQLNKEMTILKIKGQYCNGPRISSLEYSLTGTSMERALRQGFYHHIFGCLKDFPEDSLLQNNAYDGFFGMSIRDPEEKNLGVLALYSRGRLELPTRSPEVLRILAERCASEFQRSRQEDALKILNHDLADMARNLGMKNREMESMLYVTSHDLKAPLVNILGFSKELATSLDDFKENMRKAHHEMDEQARSILETEVPSCLQYIQNGVTRMERLLNGLLKLFRIGRAPLERQPMSLNGLLQELQNELHYQLREFSVQLTLDDLPDCMGDENQLAQVFQNLVTNAIKYRDPERPLVIAIRGRKVNSDVEIEIEDNGRGIRENEKERIFQLFYRAANSKGIPGEGLGLTIVQRIVEQHAGQLRVESTAGKGTTFIIRLPGVA